MELIAHILGAAMLVNAIPHLVQGLSGYEFPTPFAKPPAVGLSRPMVNVLWAAFNLAAGGALLTVGDLRLGANLESAALCGAALLAGVAISRSAARAHARPRARPPQRTRPAKPL